MLQSESRNVSGYFRHSSCQPKRNPISLHSCTHFDIGEEGKGTKFAVVVTLPRFALSPVFQVLNQ